MHLFNYRLTTLLVLACSILLPLTHASYTPFLTQSFSFSYNPPTRPLVIPITTQCETIQIVWEWNTTTGPDPTAPYFLQIYTSTFVFPFIVDAGFGPSFDWAVPFAPGTQYQICMFDKNGNTGGCQGIYTVIPSTAPAPPACQNVTSPLAPLDIEAAVESGSFSQFGWVDQCTDISVTPKNGTPPYTFTVAPALHPPYNITANERRSMKWTVSLSWASPFFISVVDSVGNSWATGPHRSGNGPTACLALDDVSSQTWVGPSMAVGAGIGGLVFGSLAGIASAYIFMKYRRRKALRGAFMHLSSASPLLGQAPPAPSSFSPQYRLPSSVDNSEHIKDSSLASSHPSDNNSSLLNTLSFGPSRYQVEPFVLPTEDGRLRNAARNEYLQHASCLLPPRETRLNAASSSSSQVYVVHHDDRRAPVSVYHPHGTEVVELPPRYRCSTSRYHQRGGEEGEALMSAHGQQEDGEAGKVVPGAPALSHQQR